MELSVRLEVARAVGAAAAWIEGHGGAGVDLQVGPGLHNGCVDPQ